MDTMKDGVELINANHVPRPGRWVSAIIVAILAAMAIHGLVTNKNYQWNVVSSGCSPSPSCRAWPSRSS